MDVRSKCYVFFMLIIYLFPWVEQHDLEDDESNYPTYHNGYCDLLPRCICIGIKSGVQVLCEGELHAFKLQDEMIEYVEISIRCYSKKFVDLQENYYGVLQLHSEPSKVSFNLESCSEPKFSYYSLLSPNAFEKNIDVGSCAEELSTTLNEYQDGIPPDVIDIESLSIGCEYFNQTFNLDKHYFKGMIALKKLNINCRAISSLPFDLFCGTTPWLNHLIISNTKLLTLPEKMFTNLPYLSTLVLANNSIEKLTDEVFWGLNNLTHLNLEHNKISELTDLVCVPLQSLQILNINNNHLVKLPHSLSNLSQLTFLDLSDNFLVEISYESFQGLKSLSRLYLMHNNIIQLDHQSLSGLHTINYLDISGNSIQYLPEGIFQSSSLYALSINENGHNEIIIETFLQTPNLRELNLAHSSILYLRSELLFSSPHLRLIDLRGNYISELSSDFFSKNPKLVYVYLQENRLLNISSDFFHGTPILEDLNLSSNNFTILPSLLFQNLSHLLYLDLSNNSLTSIPKGFLSQLPKLQTLNLSGNNLTHLLPDFLEGTRKLNKLNLSKNNFSVLPDDIFSPLRFYHGFHHLELQSNKLEKLPDISFLEVHHLNLAYNNLEDISRDNFHNMSSLKILNISHNKIDTVTNTPLILKYQYVISLDLSGNSLSEIPNRMLMEANRLQFLDISRNSLTSFKFSIVSNMQNLTELCLAFNSIKNLRTLWYENSLPSLKVLDLSHNLLDNRDTIQSKGAPTMEQKQWENLSPMNKLPNLEKLLLSHNKYDSLFLDWCCFKNLRILDLSYNVFQHLHHKDFLFSAAKMISDDSSSKNSNILPSRTPRSANYSQYHKQEYGKAIESPETSNPFVIDLRGNIISVVDIPFSKLIPISAKKSRMTKEEKFRNSVMLLDNNPITCNCHLLSFLQVIYGDAIITSEIKDLWDGFMTYPAKLEIGNLSCWNPISIRGMLLSDPESWAFHLLPMIGLCTILF